MEVGGGNEGVEGDVGCGGDEDVEGDAGFEGNEGVEGDVGCEENEGIEGLREVKVMRLLRGRLSIVVLQTHPHYEL